MLRRCTYGKINILYKVSLLFYTWQIYDYLFSVASSSDASCGI